MRLDKNPLKSALQKEKQTYGCWVTLAHPLIPEILAPAGFDWLAIDMEHSSIDLSTLLPLIISTEARGMVPLVRVGENDPNLIKRIMDAGAYGVIVANVCSAEEAEAAVAAVKYPPSGRRGVGLYRAQGYGRQFEAYKKWLIEESVVIIQIEHIKAVNDIDAIFSVKGIDAFVIGPYDLSGSMGKPGALTDPGVEEAVNRVLKAAKKYGITPGFHSVPPDSKVALRRQKQGFKFLGFSVDAVLLGEAATQGLAQIKKDKTV
ncbi:MAG: aldolase/citrate lyase family protein [Candidatus Omnitrophica bacterium]|nr:aldolase/citrate lyase family protein [Candidatus Omnitrophota bacterium]